VGAAHDAIDPPRRPGPAGAPRPPLAVIIGIAEHELPRLRLQTPVRDAEALAALLAARHGYEVVLRRDREATKAGLERLFEQELPGMIDEERRVLVYFAGHGVAIESIQSPRGYLVPADGHDDLESLLPMQRLSEALEALACKHLLLVLDCCFGGAFRWSTGRDVIVPHAPEMYRQRYELYLATPAWQVITSAAHDERASDLIAGMAIHRRAEGTASLHSPFFEALRDGLAGDADLGPRACRRRGDGVITATELYLYLRDRLEPALSGGPRQTPQLWLFQRRHRKGEYIFRVPGREPELVDAGPLSRESSPYRGFEAYGRDHARYFHGRAAATAALLERVERQPITIVVGGSGTGKSSLVEAGLIPAVKKRHPDWQIRGPLRVGPALRALDQLHGVEPGEETVLVIDHIEELFDVSDGAEEQRRFLDALKVIAPDRGVRVVGTLRSDLEAELWESPLGARWQEIRFPLSAMTREELREAIELPAEQMVLTFHPPDMVDRLIDAVVTMPGALPLLSFILDKLYLDCVERATGDRRLVEIDRLDAGGIARALREHADAIYARLDEPTRDTLRRLLLRLVTVSNGAVTRRQVKREELRFADPAEDRRVAAVLDALTGKASPADAGVSSAPPGLRLVVRGADQHVKFFELAHDAVARDWPRFKAWWTAAQDDLLLHRKLTAAAEEWHRAGRPYGMLWLDHPRLPLVRERLAGAPGQEAARGEHSLASPHQLNALEAEFVAQTVRARARRRSRQLQQRAAAVALGLTVVIAVWIAVRQIQSERAAKVRAEDSALVEQGVRATAQAHVPGQEQEALVLAIDGLARAMAAGRPISAAILQGATEAAGYRRVELPSLQGSVLSLGCSVDGSQVVTSGPDGVVIVHARGAERKLQVRPGVVMGSAFTPDGTAIVTGDDRGYVKRWVLTSGSDPILIGAQPHAIEALAISPDGRIAATGGQDGVVRLWTLVAGATPVVLEPAFLELVTDVAFSPDGARIAASSRDGTSRVWSVSERRAVFDTPPEKLQDDVVAITSIDFSPDGARLVTGGMRTAIWQLSPKDKLLMLPDEHARFARFSADGHELIIGGRDGTVTRWDARSLRFIGLAIKDDRVLSMMRYCGGPHRVAIGDGVGRTYIHELGRDNAEAILGARGARPVLAVAFARDGRTLFAGLGKRDAALGRLERWDVASRSLVVSGLEGHGDLSRLALSPDGAVLEAETRDARALTWDTIRNLGVGAARLGRSFDTGRAAPPPIASMTRPLSDAGSDSWLDERSMGLALGRFETPRAEDGGTGYPLRPVPLSPDIGWTAVTHLDGTVEMQDASMGRVVRMSGHIGAVRAAALSPDGDLAATAGEDGTARLWDARTGAALAVFTGHEGPVLAVTFSRRGDRLATGGDDGTMRVFPVRPAGILTLLCGRLRGTAAWARVAKRCAPG
jgi:WD40 repeat protein